MTASSSLSKPTQRVTGMTDEPSLPDMPGNLDYGVHARARYVSYRRSWHKWQKAHGASVGSASLQQMSQHTDGRKNQTAARDSDPIPTRLQTDFLKRAAGAA